MQENIKRNWQNWLVLSYMYIDIMTFSIISSCTFITHVQQKQLCPFFLSKKSGSWSGCAIRTEHPHFFLISLRIHRRELNHPAIGQTANQNKPLVLLHVVSSLTKHKFSDFPTKTYVVGTQKNRLNETVLLSTQNIC